MNTLPFRISVIALATALVTACGGGGGSEPPAPPAATPQQPQQPPSSSTPPPTATAPINPKLVDCFTWSKNTKYEMTNGARTLIIEEQFAGQAAIANMILYSDDKRSGGPYFAKDDTSVQVLGFNFYDQTGTFTEQHRFSPYRIPLNMTPNEVVRNAFTITVEPASGEGRVESTLEDAVFVGLENVQLGGRTFTDACKFRFRYPGEKQATDYWFAKGFGIIRTEELDEEGSVVPGSRLELATILTAP
jgi:hypothetical protein